MLAGGMKIFPVSLPVGPLILFVGWPTMMLAGRPTLLTNLMMLMLTGDLLRQRGWDASSGGGRKSQENGNGVNALMESDECHMRGDHAVVSMIK